MIIGIDASRAALAYHTGTETYTYQLLLALATLANEDKRLRLYTHQLPQANPWPDNSFTETRVIPFPRLWTHLRLAFEIQRDPPDVLFVPAHVLPLHCPVPTVVTVHDLGYLFHPEAHTAFQRWYLDWSTRRHTRVAQHLIADSAATRDDLVTHYHADLQQISVVHLGHDPTVMRIEQPGPILSNYGIEGNYLLYLGTLQPRKNLLRLVSAFQRVNQDHPVQLVLAGNKGWLYNEIFNYIQALNLQQQVILPGYVAAADKAALMSGALAFLFPSLYEGFGIPLLEAMACGTPILTSTVSCLPEVAGDAALLVDPYDENAIAQGMTRLVTEPDLRQDLVERGFRRLATFSWEQAAQRVWQILTTVGQSS